VYGVYHARRFDAGEYRVRSSMPPALRPIRRKKGIAVSFNAQMDGVKVEPSSQELTVMFVDVVGFSLSAERMDPPTVFRRLRELLIEMTTVVHQHGGIIDKVLGDGFLAFFGY